MERERGELVTSDSLDKREASWFKIFSNSTSSNRGSSSCCSCLALPLISDIVELKWRGNEFIFTPYSLAIPSMQPFDRVASPTPQTIHQRMIQWSLTDLTVSIPSSSSFKNPTSSTPTRSPSPSTRSRWNTKEFYFYYLIFLVVVPNMYYSAVKVSSSFVQPRFPSSLSLARR